MKPAQATVDEKNSTMSAGIRIMGAASALVGALLVTALLRNPEATNKDANDPLRGDANLTRERESNLLSGRPAPPVNQSATLLKASSMPPLLTPDQRAAPATALTVSMPPMAEDVQIASPEVAGQIAEAEREMASQGKDPLISPAMETRIFSEIAQKALGLEITYLQADCRITLCRVQLVLPKSFLEKKFGNVPRDAVWTGREPLSFFIKALDLEWRYTTAFGGLDRYGTPVVLGYVAMPSPSPER